MALMSFRSGNARRKNKGRRKWKKGTKETIETKDANEGHCQGSPSPTPDPEELLTSLPYEDFVDTTGSDREQADTPCTTEDRASTDARCLPGLSSEVPKEKHVHFAPGTSTRDSKGKKSVHGVVVQKRHKKHKMNGNDKDGTTILHLISGRRHSFRLSPYNDLEDTMPISCLKKKQQSTSGSDVPDYADTESSPPDPDDPDYVAPKSDGPGCEATESDGTTTQHKKRKHAKRSCSSSVHPNASVDNMSAHDNPEIPTIKRPKKTTSIREPEVDTSVHHNQPVGDEDDSEHDNEDAVFPTVLTRMSHRGLVEVLRHLSYEQWAALQDIGFGGFYWIRVATLTNQLGHWILSNFDVAKFSVLLPGGKEMRITEDDVHATFGLPKGGLKVDVGRSEEVNSSSADLRFSEFYAEWKSQFRFKGTQVTLKTLERHIIDNDDHGDNFKRNFVVLCVSMFMQGTKREFVNHHVLRSLMSAASIKDYDWCGFVLDSLKEAVEAWHKKPDAAFKGPLFLLIMVFVDRVCFRRRKVPRDFYITGGWTARELFERQRFGNGFLEDRMQEHVDVGESSIGFSGPTSEGRDEVLRPKVPAQEDIIAKRGEFSYDTCGSGSVGKHRGVLDDPREGDLESTPLAGDTRTKVVGDISSVDNIRSALLKLGDDVRSLKGLFSREEEVISGNNTTCD